MTDQLLSISAFAREFGISRGLANAMVLRGEVPSIQIGTLRRISKRAAHLWIDTETQAHLRRRARKKKSAAA